MSRFSRKTVLSVLIVVDFASGAVTASEIAAGRIPFPVLPAPEPQFFFLCADDPALAHLLVPAYLSLGEMPVLPEYDVETQSDHAQSDKDQGSKKNFPHILSDVSRRLSL